MRALFLMCVCFGLALPLRGQEPVNLLFVGGQIADGSRIFLYPRSTDAGLRATTTELGATAGLAAIWDFRLSDQVRLRMSAEYLSRINDRRDDFGTELSDGFHFWGTELTGSFVLPLRSRRFFVHVGGGGGLYLATRVPSVAGIDAETSSRTVGWGIVVLLAAEYHISDLLVVGIEARFRDPVVEVANRYPQSSVMANGIQYPLLTEPFPSRININGNIYRLLFGVRL